MTCPLKKLDDKLDVSLTARGDGEVPSPLVVSSDEEDDTDKGVLADLAPSFSPSPLDHSDEGVAHHVSGSSATSCTRALQLDTVASPGAPPMTVAPTSCVSLSAVHLWGHGDTAPAMWSSIPTASAVHTVSVPARGRGGGVPPRRVTQQSAPSVATSAPVRQNMNLLHLLYNCPLKPELDDKCDALVMTRGDDEASTT